MSVELQELLIISRRKVQTLSYGLSGQEHEIDAIITSTSNLSLQTAKNLNRS
jgi:hypothetical protein